MFSINWNQTKNITLQVNKNFVQKLTFTNLESLDLLLRKYLENIDHPELIDKNINIKYFYNSQQLQFGDEITIGEFFFNDYNPLISVVDINNLIRPINATFKATNGNMVKIIINSKKHWDNY